MPLEVLQHASPVPSAIVEGNAIDFAYSSSKAKQKSKFVVSLPHLFCGEFFNGPINDKIINNIVDVRNHNVLISSYSI